MEINRRTFLRLGGALAVGAMLGAGNETAVAQEPKPEYTERIFEGCPYQGTEITDMTLGLWKRTKSAWIVKERTPPVNITPQEIIDKLYEWLGRDTWQDYASADPYGLGDDYKPVATLYFTLGYNERFGIHNDPIDIVFGKTASGEGYVMAQVSSATFGDAQGDHVGSHHLCKVGVISPEHIDEVLSWFVPAQ